MVVFRGGNLFQHRTEFNVLRPDLGAVISSAAGCNPAIPRNSSRAKMASSATDGCVR